MLSAFANIFKIPELRKRILFTFALIFICRLVAVVPTPGVDPTALKELINTLEKNAEGSFMGFVDIFSGGAFSNCTIGALAIWPYISASIIIQLMTAIIPMLGRLAQEGDTGRQKLTQYTRYLTIFICVLQGLIYARMLENSEQLGLSKSLALNPGIGFELMTILTMTTGTMLLMWLGEQITERGIGNGISIVITVNIVSRIPNAITQGITIFGNSGGASLMTPLTMLMVLVMIALVVGMTIWLTQGQRKIPIHTAKRVVGRKIYGGQNTYMPLRVNYSGVMPIIFASPLLAFGGAIIRMMSKSIDKGIDSKITPETSSLLISRISDAMNVIGTMLQPGQMLYMILYALFIMFFAYFWVATQFKPIQIADDLKKNGGYVPGIRPGTPTAEYLDKTMTRVTLIGGIFLTIIAVLPVIANQQFQIPSLVAGFMGGTSLLIIVGVALDTMRQIESHLIMRNYDGFLSRGRLRGRR